MPSEQERVILIKALARERSRYAVQVDLAKAYLRVGESPVHPKFNPIDLAAWSQVAAILLNLSETVTRN